MTSTPDAAAAITAELARLASRLDRVETRLQLIGAPDVPAADDAATGVTAADRAASDGTVAHIPIADGPVDATTSMLDRPVQAGTPSPAAAGRPGSGPGRPVPPHPGWAPPTPGPAGWGQPAPPAWAPAPGAPAWGPPPGPWTPPAAGIPAGWAPPMFSPPAAPPMFSPPAAPPMFSGPTWSPTFGPSAAPRTGTGDARLLAWTGGAMTLLGVVLFLALAASRGWGSPAARVWSGAVFGLVLVAFAVWMHRVETRRGGAMALAGTGFGALYLVVAAANRLLQVPEPVAVLLALVVAGAGLALADRWRSVVLASGIVVGGAVLAPVVAGGPLLVALLLALQLAVAPVALRHGPQQRDWSLPSLLVAIGPALAASAVAVSDDPLRIVAVLATVLLGLAGAAAAVRRLPDAVVAVLVALAPLSALVLGPVLDGWGGAGVTAAVALLGLALLAVPGGGTQVRAAVVAVASIGLLEAVLIALDGPAATGTLLVVATALAGLAVGIRRRLPLAVAAAFGLVGTLQALAFDAPITALVTFPADPYVVDGVPGTAALVGGVVVSLLVLLTAVAITVAAGRLGLVRPDPSTAGIWVPLGVVGLYGTAGLIVTLALLLAPDRTAFTVGHAVVTVTWTVAALVLLARGLRRPALRATGMVLVAGAVGKLVLFDLVTLDGLVRVAAFLGAGLVLLAAGTRYARMVAEAH